MLGSDRGVVGVARIRRGFEADFDSVAEADCMDDIVRLSTQQSLKPRRLSGIRRKKANVHCKQGDRGRLHKKRRPCALWRIRVRFCGCKLGEIFLRIAQQFFPARFTAQQHGVRGSLRIRYTDRNRRPHRAERLSGDGANLLFFSKRLNFGVGQMDLGLRRRRRLFRCGTRFLTAASREKSDSTEERHPHGSHIDLTFAHPKEPNSFPGRPSFPY